MSIPVKRILRWLRAKWPWLARGGLLALIALRLAPAPARAPLNDPETVETLKPHVCVHTRLVDEVYEWKIQRSLQMVREMGAATIVEFFPWAYAEPAQGQRDWANFDRIVKHAQNQGLKVIARMGLVPGWARDDDGSGTSTLNLLPEESYPAFADFVAAFAGRYAGTVDSTIIWNEPNLTFEWGYRQVDVAGYARLLEAVYGPAHRANPNVVILAAPLAPTLEPRGSTNGLNDLLYLEDLYQAGAARYFDGLAMHTYGFTDPPEAEPGPEKLNFRRAELLHAIMARYDRPDRPVYITESGWNDHPRWTKAVQPSLRAAYTVDAFRWTETEWPWLKALCVWALRYPASTGSYPDNFTLITPDFQPLPIYRAIQAYARGFARSDDLWLAPPAGS